MSVPEGDATKGQALFKKFCLQCHSVVASEGNTKTGPNLAGVVGRVAGTLDGYSYSAANKNSGITWTPENLFAYLESPKKFMPGNKMAYNGMKKPKERADLIAYLSSVQ